MELETIIKLLDAGYTKAEIDAMTSKAPEAPAQEKTEETPAPAESIPAAEPEPTPVKKNSSDSSEESDRIKSLEDKLSNLEKQYHSRNLQEASAPVPPPEDNSIVGIFTKVFTED